MSRTHSPMLARTADPSASRVTLRRWRTEEGLLPPDACPEDVFGLLRVLIESDQIGQARRLILEAVRRFPGDDKIRLAKHILNDGKATPNPYVQPTATAEIEWLRNPPAEARGKWVALIGSELVGMADSAEELRQALEARKFDQYPVVQHLAP